MNIYVGNLSYDVTENQLEELFSDFGSVTEAKVIIDRDTGRSKGFGFVQMDDDGEGESAIGELNGKEFCGRNLKVNLAKPRAERPQRGPRY